MTATEKVEITLRGNALRILPGEMYVIETDQVQPGDQVARLKAEFEKATGAKCVVLSGAHLVPEDDR